jgi:hypothetical protein
VTLAREYAETTECKADEFSNGDENFAENAENFLKNAEKFG